MNTDKYFFYIGGRILTVITQGTNNTYTAFKSYSIANLAMQADVDNKTITIDGDSYIFDMGYSIEIFVNGVVKQIVSSTDISTLYLALLSYIN